MSKASEKRTYNYLQRAWLALGSVEEVWLTGVPDKENIAPRVLGEAKGVVDVHGVEPALAEWGQAKGLVRGQAQVRIREGEGRPPGL